MNITRRILKSCSNSSFSIFRFFSFCVTLTLSSLLAITETHAQNYPVIPDLFEGANIWSVAGVCSFCGTTNLYNTPYIGSRYGYLNHSDGYTGDIVRAPVSNVVAGVNYEGNLYYQGMWALPDPELDYTVQLQSNSVSWSTDKSYTVTDSTGAWQTQAISWIPTATGNNRIVFKANTAGEAPGISANGVGAGEKNDNGFELALYHVAPDVAISCSSDTLTASMTNVPAHYASPVYQWQSSTDSGSTWTNISGATSLTYSILSSDPVNSLYRLLAGQNTSALVVENSHAVSNSSVSCTGGSISYCPAPTIETAYTDFRIGWSYNVPQNTLLPDHQPWPNLQYDQNTIVSAPAQVIGSGLGSTFDGDKITVIHLSQVDESSMNTAQSAGDYIEYQFTTQATMNLAQLFNGFAFAVHDYVENYDIGIVFSEDNFATSTTLLSNYTVQTATTGVYEFIESPTDQPIYLKPSTNYKFRVIFYNATNSGAVYWDDFHISMGLCQDYSDAPVASYGVASHDQPRITTHYLGTTKADAESAVRDGGDLGVGADGDDSNRTNDEDALLIIPDLYTGDTDYTLSVSCSGSGVVAGWIDLNRDGSFNIGERNANHPVSCSGNTALITWSSLSGLPAGNSYIRLRTASDQAQVNNAIGTASDGEVEDYPMSIQETPSCDALSGTVNGGLSPNLRLINGNKVLLTSTATSPVEGHLKAYTIDADGLIVTPNTPVWDAASEMNKAERMSRLFSTNSSGNKVLFNSLDDAAFNASGIPTIADIKNYTLEPSYDHPLYIGDRRENSFLGGISPDANLGLLSSEMDTFSFLNDATYRSFYNGTVALRSDASGATKPKRTLLSSDDGFLYAFDQYNGDLGWGYIPRSLVKYLKDHGNFPGSHFMQGRIDVMDLKDDTTGYATYVVGSYKNGVGQYVLKLGENSGLDSVVWDTDYSSSSVLVDIAPNHGERAYFSDGNGKVYSAYVTSTSTGDSTLHIRSLTDSTTSLDMLLSFTATSTPYIMQDFANANANAPAKKTLYLGDNNGNLYSAELLITGATNTGNLKSDNAIQADINGSVITALDTTDSSPVLYIGASTSQFNHAYYLWAQSSDRLSLFKYTGTTWARLWTTNTSSTGNWVNGALTADSDIQSLPAGATITDKPVIVSDSIVLPVEQAPTGSNCYGSAHYYLYNLVDGHYPTGRFYNAANDTVLTTVINLGYGNARRLHLADLPGKDKLMGLGVADQTLSNSTGINTSLYIKDLITTGVRSRRELR